MHRDEHDPLPLPLLADYLRNTAFWDDWVPFLLDFPAFAERHQKLLRFSNEYRHADLELIAWDAPAAPDLLAKLLAVPPAERLREVDADTRYLSWCLCQLLLRQCLEVTPRDSAHGEHLASLALRIAERLSARTCGHEPLTELRALAWAHRGNALRAQRELRQAATCFEHAFTGLSPLPANRTTRAEILALHGAFLRDQRDFVGARNSLQRALELYENSADPAGTPRPLLILASLDYEVGDFEAAIRQTQQALTLLDPASQPRLYAEASFNTAAFLSHAERFHEAREHLNRNRSFLTQHGTLRDQVRFRWCDAVIARGLGESADAEVAYQQTRQHFLELGLPADAAVVALELSTLLLEQGRTAEVRDLVSEMLPVFQAKEIDREAQAVLLVFQNAVLQEKVTLKLARRLSDQLRQALHPKAQPG